jgi:ABC-2 type transport system ATP-binding protein
MSLIARPPVLFLDEPTTGLDPRSRTEVWDLIEELGRGGTTTLLTTQYLDEADRLADKIVVIDRGLVIARGTSEELKRQTGGDLIEVQLEDAADAPAVMEMLACHACGEAHLDGDDRTVILPVPDVTGMVPQVVRQLDERKIGVRDVAARRSTLDDVFFSLTGRTAEEVAEAEEAEQADRPAAEGERQEAGVR